MKVGSTFSATHIHKRQNQPTRTHTLERTTAPQPAQLLAGINILDAHDRKDDDDGGDDGDLPAVDVQRVVRNGEPTKKIFGAGVAGEPKKRQRT